ncbi:MAG: Uncharacterized protein G01um101477_595 [Candidatus Doudnabacteria bacterium Gr01-1014_77]|uniref:Homing endonuclease LAGLIDADG domain-containing protein n=1 Tax=Candidatus Doudnabacteria bacterium Gr01-1014_77 TaxID=2017133 RepID=A0A554JA02_9BACT|nr:MAG: Uncharacterized protein G01um101477_595 [Candidatus Doudnabacteria bacterium Gr01-1014_77]
MPHIPEQKLNELYNTKKISVPEISNLLGCSENKVNYWLKKYHIKKRSISEAIYIKRNPKGDPFLFKKPSNMDEAFLFGMGLGLYWGEGTKSNKVSVRLGNTNPELIKKFLEFLFRIYGIKKEKLRFGLQIFSDMKAREAQNYWVKKLNVPASLFQKVIITPARGLGNYRNKTKFGVLTIYYHNKKLRDLICSELEKL